MIKNSVELKKELSLSDKILIINMMVDGYFTENEVTGEIDYTPYFKEYSTIGAFALYALNGLVIEEDEKDFVDKIKSDPELLALYYRWSSDSSDTFCDIEYNVKDIVDFKKQVIISKSNTVSKLTEELLQKQLEVQQLQAEVLEQQKKMNDEYTKDEILSISKIFEAVNENMKSSVFQKAVAKELTKGIRQKQYTESVGN
jgi:Ser-tRNA(Ala) deacylase AlaX